MPAMIWLAEQGSSKRPNQPKLPDRLLSLMLWSRQRNADFAEHEAIRIPLEFELCQAFVA